MVRKQIVRLKERSKHWFKWFKKRPNYKTLYEQEKELSAKWEFKYNKLYRQLNSIIKESGNG